ncbi:MAG: serine/threonine protein phosphatase [Sphingomonadales bacterium]|nr:serine/threonine protein phosphatase [Sphingomonadales bacterium]
MIATLRNLFRAKSPRMLASVPDGQRVYAIGDIHGRLDLLRGAISAIEADDASRGAADTTVILLGDLIDRGPDSAGVIAEARAWASRRKVRMIAGNHEEMFLDSFEKKDVMRHFLRYGGRETLLSYLIDPAAYNAATIEETQALAKAAVPQADIDLMHAMEDRIAIGDYLFVHAGIEPGVPADRQKTSDLRWIRQRFIESKEDHGAIVVHGHTIFETTDVRPNRIGIDTGAYESNLLTALGLEGTSRWLIETRGADSAVSSTTRNLG